MEVFHSRLIASGSALATLFNIVSAKKKHSMEINGGEDAREGYSRA